MAAAVLFVSAPAATVSLGRRYIYISFLAKERESIRCWWLLWGSVLGRGKNGYCEERAGVSGMSFICFRERVVESRIGCFFFFLEISGARIAVAWNNFFAGFIFGSEENIRDSCAVRGIVHDIHPKVWFIEFHVAWLFFFILREWEVKIMRCSPISLSSLHIWR